MAFPDYSAIPASNTTIGDTTFIGPNMARANVRPALQQLAADGRALADQLYGAAFGAGVVMYASQAAGEAATTTGQFFSHPDGDALIYRERTAIGSDVVAEAATPSAIETAIEPFQSDRNIIAEVAASLQAGTARTIAFFGDSTMWGSSVADTAVQVATTPPAAFEAFVDLYHGNSACAVTNNAIGGTSAKQMIAGTDGSGSTFAAKMAVTTASVIYCNHALNDAVGGSTPAEYEAALVAFVTTCRTYGKAPILVTPFPNFTGGATFSGAARASAVKQYADIMRKVAIAHSVTLFDQYRFIEKMLTSGKYKQLDLLPDGTHGSQALYTRAGFNLATPLIGVLRELSGPDQFQLGVEAAVLVNNLTVTASTASRVGSVVFGAIGGTQTLRALVLIGEPGMDLYFGHPIWENGASGIDLYVDGSQIATGFSMDHNGLTTADYVHDYETCIIENADPGLHIFHYTTTADAPAFQYFRTRKSMFARSLLGGGGRYRELLAENLETRSSTANSPIIIEALPSPRLLHNLQFEFTATLSKESGLVVHGGTHGGDGGAAFVMAGCIVGLNVTTGYLCVFESSGPATYTTHVVGGVDLSGGSHTFFVNSKTDKVMELSVDGSYVGNANLTRPFMGGSFGVWKQSNTGTAKIDKLYRVIDA